MHQIIMTVNYSSTVHIDVSTNWQHVDIAGASQKSPVCSLLANNVGFFIKIYIQ